MNIAKQYPVQIDEWPSTFDLTNLDRFSILRGIDIARIPNTMLGAVIKLQGKIQRDWDWAEMSVSGLVPNPSECIDVALGADELRALVFVVNAILSHEPPFQGGLTIPLEKKRQAWAEMLGKEEEKK